MTTRYIDVDVGDEPTDDLTGETLELSREELGQPIWRMWLARLTNGCTPTELAHALLYARRAGHCQPGNPLAPVDAGAEDAALKVRARSLYRHLLTLHPEDRVEGLEIVRAIVAMPGDWQRLESRDPTVRDCVYAARAESDAAEVA